MPIEHIAIINHSTKVAEAEARTIAAACSYQLKNHVAPAWDMLTRVVQYIPASYPLPSNTYPVYLFNDADQAGALGYHDETPEGLPYARVFVTPVIQNGGTVVSGSKLTVASVVSHEVVELFVDLSANLWASNFQGKLVALEACDPVEADSYEVLVNNQHVVVSNFVFPQWFDAQSHATVFDYLGTVKHPFEMAKGGYIIYEAEGVVKTQFNASYPQWRKETKNAPASRTFKRTKKEDTVKRSPWQRLKRWLKGLVYG